MCVYVCLGVHTFIRHYTLHHFIFALITYKSFIRRQRREALSICMANYPHIPYMHMYVCMYLYE